MKMSIDKASDSTKLFIIECKDIFLREYRIEDLDELYTLTQQPEILEFLPWWNASKEQRLDWLLNYETIENKQFLKAVSESGNIGQFRLRLGIISKETDEFIGWCCTGIKEDLPPPNREIMYAISNNHANKGYTTQAAQGIIKYLFEKTSEEELNAIALIRNIPSNRVIQKCGFDFINTIELENEEYNYYKLSKSKWETRYSANGIHKEDWRIKT
jgi:[ribosomal protein S5]-alanine N-acetyltransferase